MSKKIWVLILILAIIFIGSRFIPKEPTKLEFGKSFVVNDNQETKEKVLNCKISQLTNTLEDEENPQMKNDGTKIVYTVGIEQPEIWIMNSDGTGEKFITKGFDASWHSTENKIVYSYYYDVIIINLDTNEKTKLTFDNYTTLEDKPSFSPDGSKILFESAESISIINTDGSNRKEIINEGYDPDWSPNGNKIVYETQENNSPFMKSIWIYDIVTNKKERITIGDPLAKESTEPTNPSFSPSENKIIYRENRDIWIINLDTNEKIQVTSDYVNDEVSWNYNEKVLVTKWITGTGNVDGHTKGNSDIYKLDCSEEPEEKNNQQTLIPNYIQDQCIYITNFHFNAAGNDNYNLNDEYVTFANKCSYSIDMVGWTIKDVIASHIYTIPSFTFQAGATFTLFTGTGTNTNSALYWGRTSGNYAAIWNSGGDTLFLRDSNGNLVLSQSYSGY